jgi:hypothetical protein
LNSSLPHCGKEPSSACGGFPAGQRRTTPGRRRTAMNQIIYLIGLIVVILAILSFFGLR